MNRYIIPLTVLVLSIMGVAGWLINIGKLFGIMNAGITSEFILRILGMFVPPFGAIMGYL